MAVVEPSAPGGAGVGDSAGAGAGSVRRIVDRRRARSQVRVEDEIAEEVPVAFVVNGRPFAVMLATPADLEDFALGFMLSEGLVGDAGEVEIEGIAELIEGFELRLRVPAARARALEHRHRALEGRSGCGICGTGQLETALRQPGPVAEGSSIDVAALRRALRGLRDGQRLNARTGATHAAGWAGIDGGLQLLREDIGRHNALDKLVGAMARAGLDPAAGFCVVTSRASYEMAMKAASAGMPLLAAISAPTALAIALSERCNLTLVGFAREDGHAVYTHPRRLLAGEDATP